MTAIPPVGVAMPPVVSEAASATAGAPAAGDQLQSLLGDLNFSELEGEFFSGPELLGALGTQGNAMLRDFLGRFKKSETENKAFEGFLKGKGGDPEAENGGAPLHGGPAREPFKRGDPSRTAGMEITERVLEDMRLRLQTAFAAKLATLTSKAVGELIKGQ